jgi:chromate reductase
VEWLGRNLINKHWGTAPILGGSLEFLGGELSGGSFRIDLKNLACTDLAGTDLHDVLIAHLHDDDFFDVESFPEAAVAIREAHSIPGSSAGAPNLHIVADLTLRGRTHPIEFDAAAGVTPEGKAAAQAAFAIDRTRWGGPLRIRKVFSPPRRSPGQRPDRIPGPNHHRLIRQLACHLEILMKTLVFGASTSSQSINRRLANYAASKIPAAEVTDLDLRRFELPIYSADEEEANGIPAGAREFRSLIETHHAVVVSMAEHNGSYTAAFKNLYDWTSRIEVEVWAGKPMLLLSASPGARGGASVMETARQTFSRMGADVKATFSLPSFYENFSDAEGITDPDLAASFREAVELFAAD